MRIRAEPEDKTPNPDTNAAPSKVDKLIQELKSTGMTTGKAKEVLRKWSQVGVEDAQQLRKLLVNTSLAPVPALSFQAFLDAVCCYGGFYVGNLASRSDEFPFRIGLELLGYFLGLYYFIQVLAEVSVIGSLFYTSYRYGTTASELLSAVQQMAGPTTGLSVVDKATRAVNVFKILSALEAVASALKEQYGEPPKGNSLRNLGAYLTLSQAKSELNFRPEDFGLTEREASNIAYAFAVYDTNQNFTLETSELDKLCSSLGRSLEQDELQEAVKILGSKTGDINFIEFVDWWVKKTFRGRATAAISNSPGGGPGGPGEQAPQEKP